MEYYLLIPTFNNYRFHNQKIVQQHVADYYYFLLSLLSFKLRKMEVLSLYFEVLEIFEVLSCQSKRFSFLL